MDLLDNGTNPLRWDCEKQGCFNKKRRPKIEVFAGCFPRRINFGDVDGLVELNGRGLLLEWKCGSGCLPKGQEIAHKKLTEGTKLATICVTGDAESMECSSYGFFWDGKWNDYRKGDIESVKNFMRRWSTWAMKQKP